MAYYRKVEEAPMPDAPDLTDIVFPGDRHGGGYSLKMIEPGMKYPLVYEDPARGSPPDFTHPGLHPPHRLPPGKPPFMQTPQYAQIGHVEGWMTLRGEHISLDGNGLRTSTK